MAATRLISRTLLAATTVAGAALTPAAHAAPAAPAAPTAPPHEVTFMNLSVQPEQARDARTAVLTCDPAGGTHPNAAAACQTLAAANGDFQALPTAHSNVVCPQIYKPVVFTARGTWHDKPVQFQKKFANACQASAQTGQVFKF